MVSTLRMQLYSLSIVADSVSNSAVRSTRPIVLQRHLRILTSLDVVGNIHHYLVEILRIVDYERPGTDQFGIVVAPDCWIVTFCAANISRL